MRFRNVLSAGLLAIAVLAAAGPFSSTASGQTSLVWVGGDLTTNDAWRTTDVAKLLDADGDNVYGTDGYLLFNSGSSAPTLQPTYATGLNVASSNYGPAGSYIAIDDPATLPGPAPIGNINTGTAFGGNSETDFAQITVEVDGSFRLGVFQDNQDNAAISPVSLRLRQTAGGSLDTGLNATNTDRDLDGDWYFFDVIDAQIGDVFLVSGLGDGGHGSNGIGGITFDTLLSGTTLTWNAGAAGNWSDATWTGGPPTFPNSVDEVVAVIDTAHTVTIDGARSTMDLELSNGGSVDVAAATSLTVTEATTVAAGSSITIQGGGTFSTDTGTVVLLKTNGGAATVGVGTNLDVTTWDVQSVASTTLAKTGTGDLNLGTVSNGVADTAISVQGGTLRTSGATPLGSAGGTVTLDGGTFAVDHTAEVTVANPIAMTSNGGGLEATTEKVNYGAMTIPDGATLSTSGAGQTTVPSTTLSGGSATIASANVHNVGTYADGGANNTITIAGGAEGATVFDNRTSGISAANTTLRVTSGTLEGIGNNALGGAGVKLAGGTLKVSLAGGNTPPDLSGVNAHFDASDGVTLNGNQVTAWADLSGNNHNATLAGGTPLLVTNALNGQSIVQFRGNDDYLNVADTLLSKEQYVVVRSPNAVWSEHGAFLGRTSGRASNYLTQSGQTGFHSNEYPVAVSLNGNVIDPTGPLGTITDWMLLKIDVNDGNPTLGSYYLGRGDYSGVEFDVAEIISFDHMLTVGEENDLGAYLAWKYNLTTSYTGGPYGPLGSGNLDMTSTDLTVEADSTLDALTDGSTAFGSLQVDGGVVTAQGSPNGISFTDTTVATGVTGGVSGAVALDVGPVTIGNGATFVANGDVTADSLTLTGSTGGVSTDGTFDMGTYDDGTDTKTLAFGGTGTVTMDNTSGGLIAADTTLRLTGATVNASGTAAHDPLGGATNLQLAGGTLSISTTDTTIDLSTRALQVEADSGLDVTTAAPSAITVGSLTFVNGVLTLSGLAPSFTFADTTIDSGATQVGFASNVDVDPGVITGNDAAATLVKSGSGNLLLDQTNTGLGNAMFDIQGGTLVLNRTDAITGADVHLSGGNLQISSPGGDVDHAGTNLNITQNATITAGKGDYGVDGPVTASVGSAGGTMMLADSKYLYLNSTDDYTLEIANDVTAGSGSIVYVQEGTVNLIGTGTQTFHRLDINQDGGTPASLQVDGDLNVNENLYVRSGGTLNTTGNITARYMDLQNGATFTRTGDLTIDSGGQLYIRNHNVDMTGQTLTTAGARLEIADGGSLTSDAVISAQYIYGYQGSISAPGFNVTEEFQLNNGSAVLNVTGTGTTLTAKNLNLYNGTVNMNGNSIDITNGGRLYIGGASMNLQMTGSASLTTASNATVEIANGTLTTDKALDVGNLTIQSAGTLNRTGATAPERDVSVQSNLYVSNNTFDTTGSTLSVGNRIELRSGASLVFDNDIVTNQLYMNESSSITPGGNLTFNGQVEIRGGSTLDMTGRTFTTSQTGTDLYIADPGSVLTVDGPVTVNYLEISNFGQLVVNDTVTIRDRAYLRQGVHNYDIAGANGTNSYVQAVGENLADYNTDYGVYVGGNNTYEGRTEIHNASVMIADEGVGLPVASTLRFHNGAIGTSGTFQREIGSADGGGIYWDSYGGFAGYGGDLTVSLATAAGGANADLTWSSNTEGFNGQRLYLGSAHATHDVEVTNNINIDSSNAYIYTYSPDKLATLSGDLTGSNALYKLGRGTLVLSGDNSSYTGELRIDRGVVDMGATAAAFGGNVHLYADQTAPEYGGAILQGNGTLAMNIGSGVGEVRWGSNGGGFAARGAALDITLELGSKLNWGDSNTGFNSTRLMFGSKTADNVVTLTNDIDAQNGYRYIHVYDNPYSATDKAVLSGTITNLSGLELRGGGTLQINGVQTTGSDTNIYEAGTTLAVIGSYQAGSDSGQRSSNSIYLREGASMSTTVDLTGAHVYNDGTAGSRFDVGGNLNAWRFEVNSPDGGVTVGGTLYTEEHMYIRNRTAMTVGGNLDIHNTANIESGSQVTVDGNITTVGNLNVNGTSGGVATGLVVNAAGTAGKGQIQLGTSGTSNMYVEGGSSGNPVTFDGNGSITGGHIQMYNYAAMSGNWDVNTSNYFEIHNNASISPGNSIGTINVTGNMTMQNVSTYNWDLGIGTGDLIDVNGTLTLNNTWNLVIGSAGGTSTLGQEWDLFSYSGNLQGGSRSGSQFTGVNISLAGSVPASWNIDSAQVHFDDVAGRVYLVGLEAFPSLVWDGSTAGWATGAGSDSYWDNGATIGDIPDATMEATIDAGQATVSDGGREALRVQVNGGELRVVSGGNLTVTQDVTVGTGGTLTVQGTLTADTLNSAGATAINSGATGAITTLNVTEGTTTVGSSSVADANASGGTLNLSGSVDALNVSAGAAVHVTGSASATTVSASGGNLNLTGGDLSVATMTLSGASVNTGSNSVIVSSQLEIGNTTFAMTGGTFQASSAQLENDSAERTLTLSGGTLTMTRLGSGGGFVPLANITATAEDNGYANISNTVAWVGMDRGTQAAPDKDALQNATYQDKWTPGAGNYWGKWHLDSVSDASFTLESIYWWQYNQSGLPTRGVPTAELYYSNSITDPGNPKDDLENWTLFYDNTGGTAWPLATGAPNDHTVVDLILASTIDARWISMLPTTPSPQDGNGIGTILFTQAMLPSSIDFPNTHVAVTAATTLELTTTEDAQLGDLIADLSTLVPGQTLLTISSEATGITFGDLYVDGVTAVGSYTLLDWSNRPGGSAAFYDGMFANVFVGETITGSLAYTDSTVTLEVTGLIPEPATVGLLAIGGLAVLVRRRRRHAA